MVKLAGMLGQLQRCRVLVVGDLMLDAYTIGKAKRISPEAPVAVVHVCEEQYLPGGAGNVLLNLVSMGAEVVALGRVGSDEAGVQLKALLQDEKIDIAGIIQEEGYPTPIKNRIIADNQQIVRIDHEKVVALTVECEERVAVMVSELLARVDIVAISDYGKGFLTPTLLQSVIRAASAKGIPVIVDPKGFDYRRYSGADIIKPNQSETYAAAGVEGDVPLEVAVEKILSVVEVKTLMVTRAAQGISLFHAMGGREDFPVRVREVKDVTGAGDTVLAMLTVAVASGLSVADAAQLCNIAAGIALEKVGCARVTLSQLALRLLELDGANKVFTRDHQDVLQLALRGQKVNILNLPNADALTADLYKSIKAEAQPLVIALKNPHPEFVNILSSLKEVHSIILN